MSGATFWVRPVEVRLRDYFHLFNVDIAINAKRYYGSIDQFLRKSIKNQLFHRLAPTSIVCRTHDKRIHQQRISARRGWRCFNAFVDGWSRAADANYFALGLVTIDAQLAVALMKLFMITQFTGRAESFN